MVGRLPILLTVLALILSGCTTTQSISEIHDDSNARPAPTVDNIKILERADNILSSEEKWNRQDTRECHPGVKKWSLFCALAPAPHDVTGTYEHRRAALQEIRRTIEH